MHDAVILLIVICSISEFVSVTGSIDKHCSLCAGLIVCTYTHAALRTGMTGGGGLLASLA